MKESTNQIIVFWFRRDLRIQDNHALYQALKLGLPILPIFIFDPEILIRFEDKKDRRVNYIHWALNQLSNQFNTHNIPFKTFYDSPQNVFQKLSTEFNIKAVFFNRDYEPDTLKRDQLITEILHQKNIEVKDYKDHTIFDKEEILKKDATPYTVFTPYSKKWLEKLNQNPIQTYDVDLAKAKGVNIVSKVHDLSAIGYQDLKINFKYPELKEKIVSSYDRTRDFPSIQTTELGIALRFGTISIRSCVTFALQHNQTWLKELIWRDFFIQILYHFPRVVNQSFKLKHDNIQWRNNEEEFDRWCKGETGYPIIDAGMRQLNQTGFMHNRVRMIVASFLCKHLLIDWRWGEAYFAQKLNDYELASNNGNWQWAASSGCDAVPYFRIFNPTEQTKKFDPNFEYCKKWIDEWDDYDYYPYDVTPMIEHKIARERALLTFKRDLNET